MSDTSFNPRSLEGFIVDNPRRVQQKLQRFVAAGASKIHYLFDFDRTLTTASLAGKEISTWEILHDLLPEEAKQKSRLIRDKYLAMEAIGALSAEDTHTWSSSVLHVHLSHGTNIKDVAEAAKQITLRPGTTELFAACQQAQIPTIIVSAGVSDVIELIAEKHAIRPDVLISIKLLLDDAGRIIGWDQNSMVHTHNKREKSDQILSSLRTERPYTVLIGDTLEDANMANGDLRVLRVRVCNHHKEHFSNPTDYLQRSFAAGYDMVIEGDLYPLVALTNWLSYSS